MVHLPEDPPNRGPGLGQIAVLLPAELFVLQRREERLAGGVVERISPPAHADGDLVLLQ